MPQGLHMHALQGIGGTTPARVAGRKLRQQGLLPALLDPLPAPPAPMGCLPALQDSSAPASAAQQAPSTAAAAACPIIAAPHSSSAPAMATQLLEACQAAAAAGPSLLASEACMAAAPAAAGTHPAQALLPAASAADTALPPALSAAAAGPAAGTALPAHVQPTPPAAASSRYSCTPAAQQHGPHGTQGMGTPPGSTPWLIPPQAPSSLHQARGRPPPAAEQQQQQQQQQQQASVPGTSAELPQTAAPQAFALHANRPACPQPSHQHPPSSQLMLGKQLLQQSEPAAGVAPPADMPSPRHHPPGSSFRTDQHAGRASERGPAVPAGARDMPGPGTHWAAVSAVDAQRVPSDPAAAAGTAAHDDPDYDPEG